MRQGRVRARSHNDVKRYSLAAFLSELSVSANDSAIIFDDPVSSLDHEYREALAKRLADEAAGGRQVIVFTHDIAFLFMLSRTASISDSIAFISLDTNARTRPGPLL